MSDDLAFLAAIRAQPDDAVLRLVYADWLEERGDPRHELIRAETAMRAVPIWSDEFQRLKPTRNSLRKTLPPDWLTAMDYQPKHRPMFGTLPPTAAERWRLAEEFIDIWHGGLKPGDGYTEAEVVEAESRFGRRFPAALRSWYLWAGKRDDIWNGQYSFIPLDSLDPVLGHVAFREQSQGDSDGYIEIEDETPEDPPVYSTEDYRMLAHTFSAEMLDVLLFETVSSVKCEARYEFIEAEPTIPNSFQPAALRGHWEATDIVISHGFGAICRTEEASQTFLAAFSGRVNEYPW